MSFFIPRKFRSDRRGNVAMMYALILPVLMFGAGLAIDYTHAAQVRTELNAAADAAVLAALTPGMMQQSNATAQTAAQNMFNGQISGLTSLAPGDTSVTIAITNPNGNTLVRNVTVSYVAQNENIFAGVLGAPTFALSGSSTASASIAANINFYLLLDNSPSMSLPATQAGINTMVALTAQQDGGEGCAFACHQASTNNGDTEGNPCAKTSGSTTTYAAPTLNSSMSGSGNSYCAASKGTQIDNYQLARNNSITLRLDELNSAVCCSSDSMMYTANAAQTSSTQTVPPKYEFSAYSMDTLWNIPTTNNLLMNMTSNYMSGWTTASANFGVMEMYANNDGCGNSACTTDSGVGDVATNYDVALSSINATMPNPGNGTNVAGDTPQEVLFFITDGVEDELSGGARLEQQINASSTATDYCTTIKNRGIRIAILYTTYLPVPNNAWYEQYIAPFQPDISPALQACASTGLFYQAAIGDDLGADLSNLFETVTQTAHLTN